MPLVFNTAIPTSVPVRNDLASRRLLQTRLQNADSRPIVISAPSGFGKTSLAAQHASRHANVLWFDGAATSCRTDDLLATSIELLLDQLPEAPGISPRRTVDDLFSVGALEVLAGTLLVVDDHGSHPDAEDSASSVIEAFAPLCAAGLRILIVTSADCSELAGARGNSVALCAGDLIVSVEERDEWGSLNGLNHDAVSVREAHAQSHGIPALFATSLAGGGWGAESVRQSVEILQEWMSSPVATPRLRAIAMCMLLLGRGTFRDLAEAGLEVDPDDLEVLQHGFPLLGIDTRRSSFSAVSLPISTAGVPFHEVEAVNPGVLERVAEMLARVGSVERASEVYFSLSPHRAVGPWLARWGERLVELGALPLIEGAVNRLSSREQVGDGALLLLRALSASLAEGPQAARPLAMAATLTGAEDPTLVRKALILRLSAAIEGCDEDEMRSMVCELSLSGEGVDGHRFGSSEETGFIAHAKALLGDVGEALEIIHGTVDLGGPSGDRSHDRSSLAIAEIDRIVSGGTNISQIHSSRTATVSDATVYSALVEAELGYSKALALRSQQARGHASRSLSYLRGVGLESLAERVGFIEGMCDATEGDQTRALEAMESAVANAIGRGESLRANEMRILQAMALRAFGRTAEALVCAECAVEFFSTRSCMQYRVASTLELAASMAALSDFDGACACLESGVCSGELPEYLGYRRALIIAACRLSTAGRLAAAQPLRAFATSSLHESNAWVLQMYLRAFPMLHDLLEPLRRGEPIVEGAAADAGETTVSSQRTFDGPAAVLAVPEGAISVRMFGGFELQQGSLTVQDNDWHKRKSRSLFAALVLHRGKDVSREVLFERFWPDMDIDRARDNFYVTWSNMKRTLAMLGEPGLFVKNRNGICRVDSRWVVSDVDEFEAITAQVVMHDVKTQQREILELYRRLQYIYQGELLGGNLYDDWFSRTRVVYHDAFLEAMSRASDIALSIGDIPLSLWFARKAIECDETREELFCALMKAQIAANQRSSALETFHRCRTYLADELGLDPSAETMDLYNDLLMMDASVRYGVPRNRKHPFEGRFP